MKKQAIEYVRTAVNSADFPQDAVPEIAIAGRSNAGKSSFINALAGRDVAHVSKMPGKTATLNFFQIGKHYRLVDMPGYGFAVRSETDRKQWQEMIERYAQTRPNLIGMILVHDIRRDWEKPEIALSEWLRGLELPVAVGLSKSDKLLAREVKTRESVVARDSGADIVMSFSSLSLDGTRAFEDEIFRAWVKPYLAQQKLEPAP